MIYNVNSPLFLSFLNHKAPPKSAGTLALSLPSCDLPGDIVVSIVSRLPVISVMRFQLVHKSWRALFSDPSFISMHFKQTYMTSTERIIYETTCRDSGRKYLYSAAMSNGQYQKTLLKNLSVRYKVEDCCSGLICLRNLKAEPGAPDLYFWNPAIRKVKVLPNYVRARSDRLGFGYLPHLNDYKVVRMGHGGIMDETRGNSITRAAPDIDVFSFRSNSWRNIPNSIICFTFDEIWAFANGAVHWRVFTLTSGIALLAFDMTNETLQIIGLPSCYGPLFYNFLPKRLGESLSLVANNGDYWHIWVMREYGVATSWSNQYKVSCMPELSVIPSDFTRNGELLFRGEERSKHSLHLLNLEDSCTICFDFEGDISQWNAYPCAENLILLDGGDDIAKRPDVFGRCV